MVNSCPVFGPASSQHGPNVNQQHPPALQFGANARRLTRDAAHELEDDFSYGGHEDEEEDVKAKKPSFWKDPIGLAQHMAEEDPLQLGLAIGAPSLLAIFLAKSGKSKGLLAKLGNPFKSSSKPKDTSWRITRLAKNTWHYTATPVISIASIGTFNWLWSWVKSPVELATAKGLTDLSTIVQDIKTNVEGQETTLKNHHLKMTNMESSFSAMKQAWDTLLDNMEDGIVKTLLKNAGSSS